MMVTLRKWLRRFFVGACVIVPIWFLIGPRFPCCVDKNRKETARVQAKMLAGALRQYRADHGHYPSEAEGLKVLLPTGPNSTDGYIDDPEIPLDPWGHPYVYRLTPPLGTSGGEFQVYSKGLNGIDEGGTGDDIGP
ncbi:MAG: type II secretion system protein GspG [Burkholderiales bacterium]|nr:type II secretion system protein GspG [Burkholderiales bacterium]